MRVLYVVHIPDGNLARCIDAIRVIANSGEKNRAHITVRGPYSHPRDIGSPDAIISGARVSVRSVGNFFNEGQNTVFFPCEAAELSQVWDKRDYGFNPHITLYDGPSRSFAQSLWDVVRRHTYDFSFRVGGLTPLVSRSRQGGLSLLADFDGPLISRITGTPVDASSLLRLETEQKLDLIDNICERLSIWNGLESIGYTQRPSRPLDPVMVEEIGPTSPLLPAIQNLARQNSATLGFLPDGAFAAYASKHGIIAATSGEGRVLGYVVYRVARMRATLVHLCVANEHRDRGIANCLFGELVRRTRSLRGILVNSRRDFQTHSIWPHFGFAAIGEMPGRGHRPTTLTKWWYEHPHNTLFSNESFDLTNQPGIDVAIDLNIFYDFYTPNQRNEESAALQADWLLNEVVYCVTPEVFNEIDRLPAPSDRAAQKRLAHEYKRISGSAQDFRQAYSALLVLFKKPHNVREESDLLHLAHVAASSTQYFVTRDSAILKFTDQIETMLGVTVLTPSEFIISLDEIRNTISYQPARLNGSQLRIRRISRDQSRKIPSAFVASDRGETKSSLRNLLNKSLASPGSVVPSVIEQDGEPIVVTILNTSNPPVLGVQLLRVRRGNLASTLARQTVSMIVESAVKEKCSIIKIVDPFMGPLIDNALHEAGFVRRGSVWTKVNLCIVDKPSRAADELDVLARQQDEEGLLLPDGDELTQFLRGDLSATDILQAERKLKPAKLIGGALPTCIVPIKATWAQHLFDSGLAEQTLFGAHEDLILSWENVYYRSPRKLPVGDGPFRILWYVGRDRRYSGSAQIRAYSIGSSADILEAQEAYRLCKRFGVYSQKQVLQIAKNDPRGPVMVIRFSDTEQFRYPINLKDIRHYLAKIDGLNPVLQSPFRVSEDVFTTLYKLGTGF